MKRPTVLYFQVCPGKELPTHLYDIKYHIDIPHTPELLWIDIKMQFIYGVAMASKDDPYLFDNLHKIYDAFTEHHLTDGWQALPVVCPTADPTIHRYAVVEIDYPY